MANLYPVGAQELSVAEDATSFVIDGILLELSDVLPGDELCTSGAFAPIATVDDSGTHTLGIPWPDSTITSSTSWWIRRVSDQRLRGIFLAQQASRVQTHFAQALALGLPYRVLAETDTPPSDPEEEDRYLIGTAPTGAWASNAKCIATWFNGGWDYVAPTTGATAVNTSNGLQKVFNGTVWIGSSSSEMLALTVKVRETNTDGAATDLVFTNDGDVLKRSGSALVTGKIEPDNTDFASGLVVAATSSGSQFDIGWDNNWRAIHHLTSDYTATHGTNSMATLGISRVTTGSGSNGPATADYGGFIHVRKRDYLTSTVAGEIDGLMINVLQGRVDDGGGILINASKVSGTGEDTGGLVSIEAATRKIDTSGTVTAAVQSVVGIAEGAGGPSSGGLIGFFTEARGGDLYAGYYSGLFAQYGAEQVLNHFVAASSRDPADVGWRVDGSFRTHIGKSAVKQSIGVDAVTGTLSVVNAAGTDILRLNQTGSLALGQKIGATTSTITFNANGNVSYDARIQASAATGVVGGAALTIHADGGLFISGELRAAGAVWVAGSYVLGTRKTGWAQPTGTATRTAFATSTATTAEVAERLKALIDDLYAGGGAHALIGA